MSFIISGLHMISRGNKRGRIRINITTYKSREHYQECKMEDRAKIKCCNKGYHNQYVCAICLNSKTEDRTKECCKKIPKSCPICQKNQECNGKFKERDRFADEKEPVCALRHRTEDCIEKSPNIKERSNCSHNTKGRLASERDRSPNAKTVQTSDTNVSQGLTLLNEVLTVFQNNKVEINKEKVKTGLLKDAAVSTLDNNNEKTPKDKAKLTVSTFQYSIDDKKNITENGKFTLVNCCQPIYVKTQNSLDLIKHKSSSIPQMKLEELKYSLKEKSRSKDAIEEVNRMFATVRKSGRHTENSNRPMVRSGPRVLPLVKSHPVKQDFGPEYNDLHVCKCCQTRMSSGDSKTDCCHDKQKEKCDKCVYMLCCHYEKSRKVQTGVLICEHCRDMNEEQGCHNCMEDGG